MVSRRQRMMPQTHRDPTMDEATARGLLERAIAHTSKPALTTEDVDLLMARAIDEEGAYSVARLNAAAALGWSWKEALTVERFDLSGSGSSLDLSQWHQHCKQMAADYQFGRRSVDGVSRRRSGIGSVEVVGVLHDLG